MILPIVAYGVPILREISKEINKDYPNLETLISNMKETMRNASGIGLAAPQIGLPIRLFVIDTSDFASDENFTDEEREKLSSFKKVFINPKIIKQEGVEWTYNEGCLSIPNIHEEVVRLNKIHVEYQDEKFNTIKETLDGMCARTFQHEYDHIQGVLFIDRISSLKKRLINKKLNKIVKGKVKPAYKMLFVSLKKQVACVKY